MNRHKDKDPKETVDFIRGLLAGIGMFPKGETVDFAERFYSVHIEDAATGAGTNGKGASADLALASAYGEYMERLQNDFLIEPCKGDDDEIAAFGGFVFWPDEQLVSFDEALKLNAVLTKELKNAYVPDDNVLSAGADAIDTEEACEFWHKRIGDKIAVVPYYCVGADSCVNLPNNFIASICQSSGLASGNTPEEALVEGMSELCERYAKAMILNNELCPPRIPRDFIEKHFPVQAEMLRVIEENIPDEYIIVKDASLGQGIPTICMLFINQNNGTIRSKFGSHPSMAIALERCMTEQYQGYKHQGEVILGNLYTPWDAWSRQNAHSLPLAGSLYGSDQGMVPDNMLLDRPDWKFEPWGLEDNFNNKEAAVALAALLLKIGGEVYIRDNGFLGMPAFRIYVPGVSSRGLPGCGRILLHTREFGMQNACAFGSYQRGDYKMTGDFLNMSKDKKDQCAAQEMYCRAEGIPETDRDKLLEEYFGAGAAAYVKNVWRSEAPEEAIRKYRRRKAWLNIVSGAQEKEEKPNRSARKNLALELKKRKLAQVIDQMEVSKVFK